MFKKWLRDQGNIQEVGKKLEEFVIVLKKLGLAFLN